MAAPASRIIALDALRGAGMLGILAVNVQLFAMPLAARSNPTVYGDLRGAGGAPADQELAGCAILDVFSDA